MRTNSLKHKLAAGRAATIVAPIGGSAEVVEMLGYYGFDGVFLDCEHGGAGWEQVENMVRAADLAGYSAVVRVERNDGPTITRALDRGAAGVQVPHVNSAEEAQQVVEHAKFAPLGARGWAGGRASYGVPASEFARHANDETLIAVMLEERAALDNLDEILRVDHIDVFFVAPGDLAQSMRHAGETEHPEVVGAMEDAYRRIASAGRVAGALTSPAQMGRHMELGVKYLYVSMGTLLGPAAAEFVRRANGGS